jgi:asparagine synthase (glutamine-hydrolysing)
MQKYLESAHSTTTINVEQLYGALEEATIARDLPGMADVDFSLLLFCRDIRKDVTVALSGECADEIFGGYPWYRDPEIRMRAGFPWAQNTRQREEFMTDHISQNILAEEFVMDEYEKTIQQCDILPGTSAAERRIKEMVNLNQKWFMQTLLDRKDRMSMYSGLEVRVPFCDYRIAEYLYGVPWAYKEWNGQEKGLLRFAMQEYLPKEILVRKKSPYPKTHDPHYMKLVQTGLKQLLEQKDAPIFQIVKRKALEELMDAQYTWPWYGQLMAVPQTIAYMLQIDTWLRMYQIDLI